MGWKEGRDLYLLILLALVLVGVKAALFTLGGDESRGETVGAVPPPGAEVEARPTSSSGGGGSGLSVASVMSASPDDSLFARVTGPREFVFPLDHGPHPDYRTEWWYVTGSLTGEDGTLLGYQFTLFRSAISPNPPETSSAWGTNQVYLGHVAVTDAETGEHVFAERFARGAGGLAGARVEPFRVWLEGWEIASADYASWGPGSRVDSTAAPSGLDPSHPDAVFPLRIRAHDLDMAMDLRLEPGKGMILQGDRGYSRKGSQEGNASYYFSYTRMPTTGMLRVGEQSYQVTGSSWMDREWSTSALEPGQVGWDWFALQFDEGSEMMLYQIRDREDRPDPLSKGIRVAEDGSTRLLQSRDWTLEVLDRWASPVDGTLYPSRWRLRIPEQELDIEIVPLTPDQEMNVTFRYWEGAVSFSGQGRGGAPLSGRGFVEMTGYADRSDGEGDDVRIRGN